MRRASATAIGVAGVATTLVLGGPAAAQDQIQIVGSSTVFPYTQAVAERFAANTGAVAPVVESTGTGGGMQIFCEGIGTDFADITGASRAMKASEWDLCEQNGVTNVTEILLGYDGLSMAVSQKGEAIDVSKAQLFSALAAEVEVDGEVVANPYKKWSEIDPSLPDIPITVYGPPPTSGTRDAWVELVMVEGCGEFPAIEALGEDRMAEVCQRMRTDGPFIEAGENDNLIVQRLTSDPNAYGIFGYSFLYENQDQLKPVEIGGVAPNEETIESGEYARVPPAVHLRQERPSRRDPEPAGVHRGVCERRRHGPGRLPVRARPDPAARGEAQAGAGGGSQRRADGDPELLAAQQANRSIRRARPRRVDRLLGKASDSRNVRASRSSASFSCWHSSATGWAAAGRWRWRSATPPGDCTRCRNTTATTSRFGAACRRSRCS